MKKFKQSLIPITEHLEERCKQETKILVDYVYQMYTTKHSINSPECVGWLDGTENALIRNDKIYCYNNAILLQSFFIFSASCN